MALELAIEGNEYRSACLYNIAPKGTNNNFDHGVYTIISSKFKYNKSPHLHGNSKDMHNFKQQWSNTHPT